VFTNSFEAYKKYQLFIADNEEKIAHFKLPIPMQHSKTGLHKSKAIIFDDRTFGV